MVILFCGEMDGVRFFDGQPEERDRSFALLQLPGPRRRSDPILTASSGEAFLIGDEDPFSVLNFGRMVLGRSSGQVRRYRMIHHTV